MHASNAALGYLKAHLHYSASDLRPLEGCRPLPTQHSMPLWCPHCGFPVRLGSLCGSRSFSHANCRFSVLLIFLSGVCVVFSLAAHPQGTPADAQLQIPLSEKPTARRYFLWEKGSSPLAGREPWRDYKLYLESTSVLLPLPPFLYRRLPKAVKTWVLLELPMFQFDEATDGVEALQEDR